ncbi:GntR family transcriptional regulator [Phycicoccus sp. M110.8]|uniref:GntR family transcriptional regulator n=1 Tax=Phycicoccus sp. M110.8 TaxID=3075433 RepID=UPI0028FD493D|nr:GntR family transcriptional regulator [Phycicoccus sp. M110.8]MDU0313069.1 GntR family transcriptional regulator [Phycicoccus sp. M110.8]
MVSPAGSSLGSRFRSLRDEVADNLRERIVEGELPAGHRLVERDLADELEVSRITLREALQLLTSEGLVTLLPRRGAVVTAFGADEVRHLLELRLALESLAARLAATRHTDDETRALRETVSRARAAMEAKDPRAASTANLDFHEVVAQASGNPLLRAHIGSLHSQLRRLFRMTQQLQGDHVEDHDRILEAILAGDAERAEQLSLDHLRAAMDQTLQQLAEETGGAPSAAR